MAKQNYGLLVPPYDHTTAVRIAVSLSANDIEIIYGVMRNRFDNPQFFSTKGVNPDSHIFAAVIGNQLKSECYNCSLFVGCRKENQRGKLCEVKGLKEL